MAAHCERAPINSPGPPPVSCRERALAYVPLPALSELFLHEGTMVPYCRLRTRGAVDDSTKLRRWQKRVALNSAFSNTVTCVVRLDIAGARAPCTMHVCD